MTVTDEMVEAARKKLKDIACFQVYLPSEGALDDFEQGRYDGLVAALESALAVQKNSQTDQWFIEKLTADQAWTILCETPDITSPEEYPDHALITLDQLRSYMERAASSIIVKPIEWKTDSVSWWQEAEQPRYEITPCFGYTAWKLEYNRKIITASEDEVFFDTEDAAKTAAYEHRKQRVLAEIEV